MKVTGVVGLDLSLTCTGFCRFDLHRLDHVMCPITTNVKQEPSVIKRAVAIAKAIRALICVDDVVFVEDYAFGIGKGSTGVTLGELGGIVKAVMMARTGFEPLTVNISEVRKFLCGDGGLKKDMIPREVMKRYKVEPKTHDECVAFMVAKVGMAVMEFHATGLPPDGAPQFQIQVLGQLMKKFDACLQALAKKAATA